MNKMIWAISFIALTISSSFAQRLPPTVQRAAETLVRECAEDRKIKNLDLSQLDTITRF